jgi:hypothetical protein
MHVQRCSVGCVSIVIGSVMSHIAVCCRVCVREDRASSRITLHVTDVCRDCDGIQNLVNKIYLAYSVVLIALHYLSPNELHVCMTNVIKIPHYFYLLFTVDVQHSNCKTMKR